MSGKPATIRDYVQAYRDALDPGTRRRRLYVSGVQA
jgi:hypothetical protein